MKTKTYLTLLLTCLGWSHHAWAAPEILSYSGRSTVSGQAFSGQGHFKFALVNRAGQVSYWANDGNFTVAQEPTLPVAATVADGVYTVPLGDTSVTNMQAIPGQVFKDHNDVHLRIWFSQAANRPDGSSGSLRNSASTVGRLLISLRYTRSRCTGRACIDLH